MLHILWYHLCLYFNVIYTCVLLREINVKRIFDLNAKNKGLTPDEPQLSGDILFEKSITAMLLVDSQRTIIKANQRFFKLFGYSPKEIIGFKTSVLTPTDRDFEQYKNHFEKVSDGSYESSELVYKKKDNTLFWVKLSGISIDRGDEKLLLWSIYDITQDVAGRNEIKNRNRELEIIFSKVKVGLAYETDGIIERVNPSFLRIINNKKSVVLGQKLKDVIGNYEFCTNLKSKKIIKFNNRKNQAIFVEHDTVNINKHSHINIFTNVTDHITEKERFKIMAQIDGLTQIFNRVSFVDIAQNMLSEKKFDSISFVMCDIDFFKKINDAHGHDIGDQVLIELTDLISSQLRADEFFGRLGGEEFGIVIPLCKSKVLPICERLLLSIRNHRFTEKKLNITVSMGLIDDTCTDIFDVMYKRADEMLYKAKAVGKDQVVL